MAQLVRDSPKCVSHLLSSRLGFPLFLGVQGKTPKLSYFCAVLTDAFESKFFGLTGTQWSDRFNFVQQPGRCFR